MSEVRRDIEAKNIIRKSWPNWTQIWRGGQWLRAQPVDDGKGTAPRFYQAGCKAKATQPDGLYIKLNAGGFCDAIVIEVCGSQQNLNDKRSRYAATTIGQILEIDHRWLSPNIKYKKGERQRWKIAGLDECPITKTRYVVRHLRVLYVVEDEHFKSIVENQIFAAHEFYCKFSLLRSIHLPNVREFLKRMAPNSHFYTLKKQHQ